MITAEPSSSFAVIDDTCYAVVTCEIKLFQNYVTGLLQLMKIFQHVRRR